MGSYALSPNRAGHHVRTPDRAPGCISARGSTLHRMLDLPLIMSYPLNSDPTYGRERAWCAATASAVSGGSSAAMSAYACPAARSAGTLSGRAVSTDSNLATAPSSSLTARCESYCHVRAACLCLAFYTLK